MSAHAIHNTTTNSNYQNDDGNINYARNNDDTLETNVIESIYDMLTTSAIKNITFQIHRNIKTGVYRYSDLISPKDRAKLYPDLYNNNKKKKKKTIHDNTSDYSSSSNSSSKLDANGIAMKYATEVYQKRQLKEQKGTGKLSAAGKKRSIDDVILDGVGNIINDLGFNDDTNNNASNSNTNNNSDNNNNEVGQQVRTTRQQINSIDIYGRIPPKEPKTMIECTICNRQISTSRYASHLDKCLGITTTARGASSSSAAALSGMSGGGNASDDGDCDDIA